MVGRYRSNSFVVGIDLRNEVHDLHSNPKWGSGFMMTWGVWGWVNQRAGLFCFQVSFFLQFVVSLLVVQNLKEKGRAENFKRTSLPLILPGGSCLFPFYSIHQGFNSTAIKAAPSPQPSVFVDRITLCMVLWLLFWIKIAGGSPTARLPTNWNLIFPH